MTAKLREKSGKVVAQAPILLVSPRVDDALSTFSDREASNSLLPCVVQAFLPDVERGSIVAIRSAESDLWVSEVRQTKPHIANFEANVHENRLAVMWKVETQAKASELWLQWSADGGKRWNALATGLTGVSCVLDCSHLPAGSLTLRLLVSDGFDTEISSYVSIRLPRRPPIISIVSPREGETFSAGGTMRLWGVATFNGSSTTLVENAHWYLDGEQIADKLDTFCRTPSAGNHVIQLTVSMEGAEGTLSRHFATARVNSQSPGLSTA